ncbi:MAG: hypothetical protein IT548_11700 [Alphaproteobacteria bacterium]|nr:hypothetical protein [Alphaproteobacteria bacterium]
MRLLSTAVAGFGLAVAGDAVSAEGLTFSADGAVMGVFHSSEGADAEYSGRLALDAGWASLEVKPVYVETDVYKSLAVKAQLSVPLTDFGTFAMVAGNYESDRQPGVFDVDYRDVFAGGGQYVLFTDLGPLDTLSGFAAAGIGRMKSRLAFGPYVDRLNEFAWAYLAGAEATAGPWRLSGQISQRFADRDGQRQRLTDWDVELAREVCRAAPDAPGLGCRIGLAHTDRDYEFHGTRDRLINSGLRVTFSYD